MISPVAGLTVRADSTAGRCRLTLARLILRGVDQQIGLIDRLVLSSR
ncbi:MAG: hypothetical protein IPK63_15760 [Candidatus Competibacteraceae bacterium]|nr:hypothetical protein [Candidatus Competibacteraceae bacterium]